MEYGNEWKIEVKKAIKINQLICRWKIRVNEKIKQNLWINFILLVDWVCVWAKHDWTNETEKGTQNRTDCLSVCLSCVWCVVQLKHFKTKMNFDCTDFTKYKTIFTWIQLHTYERSSFTIRTHTHTRTQCAQLYTVENIFFPKIAFFVFFVRNRMRHTCNRAENAHTLTHTHIDSSRPTE